MKRLYTDANNYVSGLLFYKAVDAWPGDDSVFYAIRSNEGGHKVITALGLRSGSC